MYSEKIEQLISTALMDGVLTEKEKQILFKRAQEDGIDLDEFEMVLDTRLSELQKTEKEMADSSARVLEKKISEIRELTSKRKSEIISSCKYSTSKDKGDSSSPLQKAINEVDRDARHQIDSLVKGFPVPSTVDDLFDVAMLLKNESYLEKFEECVVQANSLFPNDERTLRLQAIATSYKIQRKADNIAKACLAVFMFLGIGLWIVCGREYGWGFWAWLGYFFAFFFGGELIGLGVGAIIRAIFCKD